MFGLGDVYAINNIHTGGSRSDLSMDNTNDMQANTDKTKYMEIYFGTVPHTLQPIVINGSEIDHVTVFKLLGFMIDNKLSSNEHVVYVCGKTLKRIYIS